MPGGNDPKILEQDPGPVPWKDRYCHKPDPEGDRLCNFQPSHVGRHSWDPTNEVSWSPGDDIDEDLVDRLILLAFPGNHVMQNADTRRMIRSILRAVEIDRASR